MEFREGNFDDIPAIEKVRVKTWQTTYQGLFPSEKLESLDPNKNLNRRRMKYLNSSNINRKTFVARHSHEGIIGFAKGGQLEQTTPFDCEIGAIYVLKKYQQQGIGSKLVHRLINFFQTRKWKTMIIWTLESNPSRIFYDKLAGTPSKQKLYVKWGCQLNLVGYTWEDISKIPL